MVRLGSDVRVRLFSGGGHGADPKRRRVIGFLKCPRGVLKGLCVSFLQACSSRSFSLRCRDSFDSLPNLPRRCHKIDAGLSFKLVSSLKDLSKGSYSERILEKKKQIVIALLRDHFHMKGSEGHVDFESLWDWCSCFLRGKGTRGLLVDDSWAFAFDQPSTRAQSTFNGVFLDRFSTLLDDLQLLSLIYDDAVDGGACRTVFNSEGEMSMPCLYHIIGKDQAISFFDYGVRKCLFEFKTFLRTQNFIEQKDRDRIWTVLMKQLSILSDGQLSDEVFQEHLKDKLVPTKEDFEAWLAHSQDKTAPFFVLGLVVPAILAGKSDQEVQILTELGERMGLFYQLLDDYQDQREDSEAGEKRLLFFCEHGYKLSIGEKIQSLFEEMKATFDQLGWDLAQKPCRLFLKFQDKFAVVKRKLDESPSLT